LCMINSAFISQHELLDDDSVPDRPTRELERDGAGARASERATTTTTTRRASARRAGVEKPSG
jgi:hypothetical protein